MCVCCHICGMSTVQGEHLESGSRSLVDFDIRLGDSVCVPVSLTNNHVDCRPPTVRPDRNVDKPFCQGDWLSVQVCTTSGSASVHGFMHLNVHR